MSGFALGIALCALLGIGATVWFKIRTNRIVRTRSHSDLNQFVGYFRALNVAPHVSTAVYEYLANLKWMKNFPVEPRDKLLDVYRIHGEELVDAYTSILARLGRKMPQSLTHDALTVETVEDLVKFVADVPGSQ